jgi:hypothetical protein
LPQAQVQPQVLGRDVRDRMIERLDVQARALAELGEVQVRVLDVPAHGEIGTIDLQHDAGLGDGLVFVPHRLRDREQVGLVVLVVVVAEEQRHHAGRGRAHERPGGLLVRQRGLEVFHILHRGARVAHADRCIAGRRLAARAAGIAEHAPGQVGEVREVLVDEGVAGAAEPVEPVLHVGGVARLRHFPVVDDVDAGLALLADHLGDGGANAPSQRRAVDRHALLLGIHHAHEIVRPRQAAGVGGEEAVGAALHGGDGSAGRGVA